jgi:hypothetical protein
MTRFENGFKFIDKNNRENTIIYFHEGYNSYCVRTLVYSTSIYETDSFMSEEYINEMMCTSHA